MYRYRTASGRGGDRTGGRANYVDSERISIRAGSRPRRAGGKRLRKRHTTSIMEDSKDSVILVASRRKR